MKFLQLSRLTIEFQTIVAVQWDLSLPDGRKTTVIYHNIPGVSPFQLYSDKPKYDEDKCLLMTALNEASTIPTQESTEEEGTPLHILNLSVRVYHCCKRAGINFVEELAALTEQELLQIKSIGDLAVQEIQKKLDYYSKNGRTKPI